MAMTRNMEANNYGMPSIQRSRNNLQLEYNHKSTFNSGDLVPFYCNTLIQPGDTIKMNMSIVCRMLTPFFPVMDNAYLDIYFFSGSWVDLWDHTKEFFGENLMAPFEDSPEYTVPIIKSAKEGNYSTLKEGTILDHLGGLPINVAFETDRFGLNLYLAVYNNYFRDQNLIAPIDIDKSDADMEYDGTSKTGGTLLKVAKIHDYFTSAQIAPQKGIALTMPIGTEAPVVGNGMTLGLTTNSENAGLTQGAASQGLVATLDGYGKDVKTNAGAGAQFSIAYDTVGVTTDSSKSGMVAMLSQVVGATLNAQRPIIAISHIQEKMAFFGSRYKERLKASWGVTAPELNLHIPEYIGGKRVPINIETIVSTTDNGDSNQLGETGAYSITADADYMFTKSFTQHSVLIGVMCIRTEQTYSQGTDCQHLKRRLYDYWDNDLAGLGMQPILKGEIMTLGDNTDKEVYGYKPYAQEYRTEINHVSGKMRPNATQSLAKWTFANNFSNRPTLSQEFIEQPREQIDNILKDQEGDQFFCDINLVYDKQTEVTQWGFPGLDKF